MTYLLLCNSMNYLSDARYDKFTSWHWLVQFLFIIINWIADIVFCLLLPLFSLVMAYVVIHPLRCLVAPPSYNSIARLDMQDWAFNLDQTFNKKLLKGWE